MFNDVSLTVDVVVDGSSNWEEGIKKRPCFKCLSQYLPEMTKINHYKSASQDSSFEVTILQEPYKMDSLTKTTVIL